LRSRFKAAVGGGRRRPGSALVRTLVRTLVCVPGTSGSSLIRDAPRAGRRPRHGRAERPV